MHSAKGRFASVVLVFGFLAATVQTQVVDTKTSLWAQQHKSWVRQLSTPRDSVRLIRSEGTPAAESSSRVTYIKSETVEASFAKGVGGQLHDGKAEGEHWALNTDDREEPGPALSHAHTTEINIVVVGTAPMLQADRS